MTYSDYNEEESDNEETTKIKRRHYNTNNFLTPQKKLKPLINR